MMPFNLFYLSVISILVFVFVMFNLIFTFSKSKENVYYWLPLIFLLFLVLASSWWIDDLALQWVLIEASTLVGSILISMSRTEKSIDVAWKFLLLNSFGLGVAFLGLIILSYGVHATGTMNPNEFLLLIPKHRNLLVKAGLWLTVFGYSTKLGLFPNHFWVSDTYAESPSQISAMISSMIPASVCVALRNLIRMDAILDADKTAILNASDGLMILGVLTMVYSLFTIFQTTDIRRITGQLALFHSGGMAAFVCLNPNDSIFYFMIAANVIVKALIFSAMGVIRIDLGTRNLSKLNSENGANKLSSILYIVSLGMAFIIPVSPFFLTDVLFIKTGLAQHRYWILLIPILSVIFFAVCLNKFLPILDMRSRKFHGHDEDVLMMRTVFTFFLLGLGIMAGIYGLFLFSMGGFENV